MWKETAVVYFKYHGMIAGATEVTHQKPAGTASLKCRFELCSFLWLRLVTFLLWDTRFSAQYSSHIWHCA